MITCHPSNLLTTTNFSMLGQRTSTTTFKLFHNFRWNSRHFRPFYPHKVGGSKFVINSSLGPLFASAAAVGSSTHAAVTSTITQVAVSAVAIASGACLSTKVDFLWPKSHDQPSPLILEGVDVTGYPIFNNPKVQKAVSFARKAHHGQLRKNGEPYLAHCLHTGRALADLVPSSGQRAADTVVAGILHDVIDDTSETLVSIRENFGNDVTQLVAGVSRLSYINQLLRRHRRINSSQSSLSHEEANNLRVMLLGMVDDPRVVLIKLADRLHNMRTIYALPLSKAQAVAEETLVVWCSLASRLGLWALKAELEDLCFAVLQPQMFCQMRAETEVSTVLSERFHSAQQTSVRSDLRSETGQTSNGKRKEPDYSSVTAEVCHESHTNKGPDHNKLLKTDSASSKESGEVVQLSSVDSTDPKPCQSSNEDLVERKPFLTQSHESKIVFLEHESSVVTTKSDSTAISLQSSRHCNFDLNEGMEENGAEFHKIPPISVVAKVGVPMGLPQKPLQFGGELGWKRSGNISAFRSTSFMNSERGSITNSNRGFDLNVAATMDSEYPGEETSVDFTSKQPEKFLLDLNCQSASDVNHHKASASSFDLNDNPVIEDTQNYIHHNQHSENQQLLRKSVAANTATCFRGNASQSNFELGRPSYWVDLSSMRGFSHVQPHPFLVAAPTAEQVQMMIPSGLYIGKVNNLSPTLHPPSLPPHLNNQHGAAALPQISGSVLAAYPGAVQFLESPQGLNPHALANMRPTFFPNGSIPLMENGSRGFGTPELLIPLKNGFFEARERPVEQVALPPSQINYRQMASWN